MNKKREGAVILMLLIEAEISWAEREQQCSVNWDTEILHHSAQLSSAGLNTRRTAVCSMFLMQQEINVHWLTAINLPIQLLCKFQFAREWRICWGSHWVTISPCDSGGQSEVFRWSGVSQWCHYHLVARTILQGTKRWHWTRNWQQEGHSILLSALAASYLLMCS